MGKRRTTRPIQGSEGPDPDVKLVRQLYLDGMPLDEIAEKFERKGVEIGALLCKGNAALLRCSF